MISKYFQSYNCPVYFQSLLAQLKIELGNMKADNRQLNLKYRSHPDHFNNLDSYSLKCLIKLKGWWSC